MDKASFDTEPKRFESISGETLICTLEVNSNSLCVTLRKEMRYISVKRTIILTILWLFALFDHTFLLPVLLGLIILSRIIFDILDTTEEMLLIVNGLGYQVSSSSMFKQVVEFYPYEKVQNSFINEVILKSYIFIKLVIANKHYST
ncbi:hypothetical protein ABEB36_006230 [Hypothenemus hampei]|uniref:Uncharacterized protein n=1 Tax=Hypothenemus hampei TaxID=57062 RepID=A0ABD1ERZ8_HYPHA